MAGWVWKLKLMIKSAKVYVEVEAELDNTFFPNIKNVKQRVREMFILLNLLGFG